MVIQRCLRGRCVAFLDGRLHAHTSTPIPPTCKKCTSTPFSLAREAWDELCSSSAEFSHHNMNQKQYLAGCKDDGVVVADELFKSFDNVDNVLYTLKSFCKEGKLKETMLAVTLLSARGFQLSNYVCVCILQLCIHRSAFVEGKQMHDYIVRHLLDPNIFLANTLINFYAKCGCVLEARKLFDRLQDRDLFSWTIMIETFVKYEPSEMALNIFVEMEMKGVKPDEICFLSVLKACGNLGAAKDGKILHAYVVMYGLKASVLVDSSLIEMYTKCAALDDALQIFLSMGSRDVVVWNLIIAAYAECRQSIQAFMFWEFMKHEGVIFNGFSFISILKACGRLDQVKQVHASGTTFDNELSLCFYNSIINTYFKFQAPSEARQVFERMPTRDVISWNSMLSGYVLHGSGQEALELLDTMVRDGVKPESLTLASALKACTSVTALAEGKEIHSFICATGMETNKFLTSTLIDMYGKCGDLNDAQNVFSNIVERDVVVWNSMIAVLIAHECCEEALLLFSKMGSTGVQGDSATLVNVLKASAFLSLSEQGIQIHACIVEDDIQSTILQNALIDMYLKCGMPYDACAVFKKMQELDVVSWNVMISGYVQLDLCEKALDLFQKMQHEEVEPDKVTFLGVMKACANLSVYDVARDIEARINRSGFGSDVSIRNGMVDMFGKCGRMDVACQVFEESSERDIISWNTVITGYVQHGNIEEVLRAFLELLQEGVEPDDVTFLSVLKACADVAAIVYGKWIHMLVRETQHESNNAVKCMLFDMYAKSGNIEAACKLWKGATKQDRVSCNALIAGYAQHGCIKEALEVFSRMDSKYGEWELDTISHVSIISACSHLGLLAEGYAYLESLHRHHSVNPSVEPYLCFIDLLSRCGHLHEALTFANNMGFQPSVDVWIAILSACKYFNYAEIAKNVANYVLELGEENAAALLLMLSIVME